MDSLTNRDQGLSTFNFICSSYIMGSEVVDQRLAYLTRTWCVCMYGGCVCVGGGGGGGG